MCGMCCHKPPLTPLCNHPPAHTAGFKAAVTDYEGLKALAKAATGGGNATRGACKVCGGLGHLTKQCRNRAAAAAAAEGNEESIAARSAMALLTEADDDEGLNELLGSSSSDSGSGSDSDDERRGRVSGLGICDGACACWRLPLLLLC